MGRRFYMKIREYKMIIYSERFPISDDANSV